MLLQCKEEEGGKWWTVSKSERERDKEDLLEERKTRYKPQRRSRECIYYQMCVGTLLQNTQANTLKGVDDGRCRAEQAPCQRACVRVRVECAWPCVRRRFQINTFAVDCSLLHGLPFLPSDDQSDW